MFKVDIDLIKSEEFRKNFCVSTHIIGRDHEVCYLIKPQKGMYIWTEDLLHFRSAIYNSVGNLVSASYPKFFNLGECEHIHPFNGDLNGTSIIEKIDGSTLIVSKYKGETIIRTRGSINAEELMNNGDEIEFFKNKYAKFFIDYLDLYDETCPVSYIFEWVSPKNKIVINYSEPDLYLTNMINHHNYGLTSQKNLDTLAGIFNFKRPTRHQFNNLKELIDNVEKFDGGHEGVCLYYNKDQQIRKIKGLTYLKLHSFKSQCTMNKLIDLYEEWNLPTKNEFESLIETNFDYECMLGARPLVGILYEGLNKIEDYYWLVHKFVNDHYDYPQKDFALKIKEEFAWNTILCGIGFTMKKGNKISKFHRGLLEDYLKNKVKSEGVSYHNLTLIAS